MYLLFVVYGSLVPLDFHPRPLDSAWRDFLETRYLTLGAESRADWVANILLYIPLAYLLCAGLAVGARSAIARLAAAAAVFVVCAAVALGVEFTQLFFPPRTVSLNDIVAEFVGSALGIGLWLGWGRALERLWADMTRGGLPAIRAAVVGYVAAYLAFSLFPYDFLVSAQEFAEKFSGDNYRLFVTSATCGRLSLCAARIFAEIVAVVPLGVLLGMALGKSVRRVYATAAICGLALGAHDRDGATLPGVGHIGGGIPVDTRRRFAARCRAVPPCAAGSPRRAAALHRAAPFWWRSRSTSWSSRGPTRGSTRAGSASELARAKLDAVHWLPFYYHYFSTETHALRSLLAVAAMYLPVGVGYWMWTLRRASAPASGNALIPALVAASLAAMMEMGKLFVPGKHPDPTDVLIAMAAAAAAYLLATRVHRWAVEHESALAPPVPSEVPQGGSRSLDCREQSDECAGGDPAVGRHRYRDLALPAGRRLADAGARVVRSRAVAPPGVLPAGGPRALAPARPFAVERLDPAERIRPADRGDARRTPAAEASRMGVRHCPEGPGSRSVCLRHLSSRVRWSGSFRCRRSTPMRSAATTRASAAFGS